MRKTNLVAQNARRGLRRRLGFCIYCPSRAEAGYTRCRRHLDKIAQDNRNSRAREQKARGWKYGRTEI